MSLSKAHLIVEVEFKDSTDCTNDIDSYQSRNGSAQISIQFFYMKILRKPTNI